MGESWTEEFPASIVVTDSRGVIISMNRRACETFAAQGGASLLGCDVRSCHEAWSRKIVEELFETRRVNAYTIEKEGVRKLVYQCPWFKEGDFAGFVELSLPVPGELPHRER